MWDNHFAANRGTFDFRKLPCRSLQAACVLGLGQSGGASMGVLSFRGWMQLLDFC